MIKIFECKDRDFSSNGDKILHATKAKIKKEDNGDFYIDIEANLNYIDYLVQDAIVVAPTPTGEQAFRLENPEQSRSKIKIKGYHVFYDSKNYLIDDSYVMDKNCNAALEHLNSATDILSPFKTISDISTLNSYRCVRKTLYEAIQVVLERWGRTFSKR